VLLRGVLGQPAEREVVQDGGGVVPVTGRYERTVDHEVLLEVRVLRGRRRGRMVLLGRRLWLLRLTVGLVVGRGVGEVGVQRVLVVVRVARATSLLVVLGEDHAEHDGHRDHHDGHAQPYAPLGAGGETVFTGVFTGRRGLS